MNNQAQNQNASHLMMSKDSRKFFDFFYQFVNVKFGILLLTFTSLVLNAQNPLPGIGIWTPSGSSAQTITLNGTGVGVTVPDGKLEVRYKPCTQQENGLVVTSLGCTMSDMVNVFVGNYNQTDPGMYTPNGTPTIPTPTFTMSPFFGATSSILPLVKINEKPMFWIRNQDPANSLNGSSTSIVTYNTKFIVMPSGNTGINTNNPRATFDVVQTIGGNNYEPTAIFGKTRSGTQTQLTGLDETGTSVNAGTYGYRTRQIMIYNSLGAKSYNRAIQSNDQAILFTDGGNTDGSNIDGALFIGPWDANYSSTSSSVGGIRIDNTGKVEVHGDFRATKVTVNTKWWSDFVFYENYNLMPLTSVHNYIKEYHHLPGIPSEKELIDSGVNLVEMQALQQQKIEELTLYSIAQDEKLAAQEALLKEQEARLKAMEDKIKAILEKK